MQQILFIQLFSCILFLPYVLGFLFKKHEFKEEACTTFIPRLGTRQLTPSPYIITVSDEFYRPNRPLIVTIKTKTGYTEAFQGFFLQAHKQYSNLPIGKWEPSKGVKTRKCIHRDDSIVHAALVNWYEILLTWNPPTEDVGAIKIVGTILLDKEHYWLGEKSNEINWHLNHQAELSGEVFNQESCITLKPITTATTQVIRSPYEIQLSEKTYVPGKSLLVSIKTGDYLVLPFRAFIIQARKIGFDTPVGMWLPAESQDISNKINITYCSSEGDTVIQGNLEEKLDIRVKWKAPTFLGPVHFVITIVQRKGIYWHSIKSVEITEEKELSRPDSQLWDKQIVESGAIFTSHNCINLRPNIIVEPQATVSPYTIEFSAQSYSSGKPIFVTLKLLDSKHPPFKGFILQARQVDSHIPVGSWKLDGDLSITAKTIDCTQISDTIAHHLLEEKTELILQWLPSPSLRGSVYFIASILQEANIYWTRIKSAQLSEKKASELIFGKSSCTTLKPEDQSIEPQQSPSPYIIIPSIDTYKSHEAIDVTILSTNIRDSSFEGFIIQARQVGTLSPVGKWSLISGSSAELRTCFNENDTVTHGMIQSNELVSLTWNPPKFRANTIKFTAAVIKEYNIYWSPISSIEIKPFSPSESYQDRSFEAFDYYSGCFYLQPNIHSKSQSSSSPYEIKTVRITNSPKDNIKVILKMKIPEDKPFKGFLLQARKFSQAQKEKGLPIGSFTLGSTLQNAAMKSCVVKDDSVTHFLFLNTREIQVFWKAPPDIEGAFHFVATVIQDENTYWEDISSGSIDFSLNLQLTISEEKDSCKTACNERYPIMSGTEIRAILLNVKDSLKRVEKRLQQGCDSCTHLCNKAYPPEKNEEIKVFLTSLRDNLQKMEKILRSRCEGPLNCEEVELLGFSKKGKYFINPGKQSGLKEVDCKFDTKGPGKSD